METARLNLTPEEALARLQRELDAVHCIARIAVAGVSVDELIRQTLSAAVHAVNAAAGSILLHDPDRQELVFRHVVGEWPGIEEALVGRSIPVTQGLAGEAFVGARGVITHDAEQDGRHNGALDAVTHYRTRNVLAVPLKTPRGDVLGVIEVLNRRRFQFDQDDIEVLEILAGQAAGALATASLYEAVLDAEREKERFCREVVRCVTQGRLELVDADALPTPEAEPLLEVALDPHVDSFGFQRLRRALMDRALEAGMPPDRADDLMIAAAEAAGNTVKHAVNGRARAWREGERFLVRVSDEGPGIRPENLPATLFKKGFSTRVSLGMGYTLMLSLVDRIWLCTGPGGTVVQLEKSIHAVPEEDETEALLDRFHEP